MDGIKWNGWTESKRMGGRNGAEYAVDVILISRENNAHINKEIYTAFREIEYNCGSQPYFDRSKRCQIVLDMLNGCINSPEPCYADEYYQTLKRIGFDLPPFYKPDYVEKIPTWKFWLRFSKNNQTRK